MHSVRFRLSCWVVLSICVLPAVYARAAGEGQTGVVDTVLPTPITVHVTRADGTPFANKLVTFRVTRSNGRLSADGLVPGALRFQSVTNGAGDATAHWTLGSDAGQGNQRIDAGGGLEFDVVYGVNHVTLEVITP